MSDLRAWLDDSDFSVASLARTLKVSRQAVYTWISGESRPSLDHFIALHTLSGGRVAPRSFQKQNSQK